MNFRVQRQLTVAIENQPGRLAAVARVLADHGINIKDLSILDSVEQGVIRLVVNDSAICRAVLQEQGFRPIEAEVVVVDLPDAPGQLAILSQALADGGVNIDYAYGSEDSAEQTMRIVMKLSPLQQACDVLQRLKER